MENFTCYNFEIKRLKVSRNFHLSNKLQVKRSYLLLDEIQIKIQFIRPWCHNEQGKKENIRNDTEKND